MDKKEIASYDSFENLSKSIVQYLLRNTNAQITQTRPNKDGGYDIFVEYHDDHCTQKAFFECKLRGSNLNLRDIAANVIIAFNHGAVALVAITNHDFTQQAGEELLAFRKSTVLNIKIIVGEEVHRIVNECGIPITSELCNYFNIKKTRRKDDFRLLKIDFDKDILCQLFGKTDYQNSIADPLIADIFHNEIRNISSSIQEGRLISVSGYLGIGKQEIILSSIEHSGKYKISIGRIAIASCNSPYNITSENPQYALSYFKLKRAFKLGQYLDKTDSSIQIGKTYYDACIKGKMTDNSGDWLGRICGCYALMVKETKGNEVALGIFENALAVLPSSFELRREYYSHIACMQLYEHPLLAFSNYTKILDLFKDEVPDSAALPFHEYGDRAMSQLMACNFEHALKLADDALEISQSNGLADEEGRCLNI